MIISLLDLKMAAQITLLVVVLKITLLQAPKTTAQISKMLILNMAQTLEINLPLAMFKLTNPNNNSFNNKENKLFNSFHLTITLLTPKIAQSPTNSQEVALRAKELSQMHLLMTIMIARRAVLRI